MIHRLFCIHIVLCLYNASLNRSAAMLSNTAAEKGSCYVWYLTCHILRTWRQRVWGPQIPPVPSWPPTTQVDIPWHLKHQSTKNDFLPFKNSIITVIVLLELYTQTSKPISSLLSLFSPCQLTSIHKSHLHQSPARSQKHTVAIVLHRQGLHIGEAIENAERNLLKK